MTEGNTGTVAAEFKVRLSRASSVPITVDYSTQDYTAGAHSDYIGGSGTLGFSAGVTLSSIVVTVRGDTLYEAAEQFYVNLTNPVNASIGRGQGIGTIFNDDLGSFSICANDVPTSTGLSTIAVDRDSIVDDVNVSLFLEDINESPNIVLTGPDQGHQATLTLYESVFGGRLGTTCSPFPNCIFDDEAITLITDAAPPYVGSFKRPYSSFKFLTFSSPRGTWKLSFSGGKLNCWCLTFGLAREGCKLAPERATARVFFPHTVRATIISNGALVENQVVSFTVRGEQDEVRFQEEKVADHGLAEFSYYDFKPGLNFIEARAMVNGVLSIAKAEVTWVADGLSGFDAREFAWCPSHELTANTPGAEATLSTQRSFRDGFLAQTPRGRKYTRLYYDFSTEAVQIMMFNPMLILRSREIIERYTPVIQAMANGEAVTLTEGDLDEIDGFMNAFAAKSSPELKETIKGLCHDLRDPQMHAEFGITMTRGPRRELPAHDKLQAIKHSGKLVTLFALGGLVIFVATGKRRKALRRHAAPTLVVLLAAAVVGHNSVQWSGLSGQSNKTDPTPSVSDREAQARIGQGSQPQPMAFEANRGQIDSQVRFFSRGEGYTMFLTPTEAVMKLRSRKARIGSDNRRLSQLPTGHRPLQTLATTDHRPSSTDVLRMKLISANPEPRITGLDELPGRSNYYFGKDLAEWRSDLPAYARVSYDDVYPGVDLLYYGNQQQLEYDFVLAPGADPRAIALSFDGAEKIDVDAAGDLVLSTSGGEVRQRRPVIYQDVDGQRCLVEGRYVIQEGKGEKTKEEDESLVDCRSSLVTPAVGFALGPYDRSKPLIIDPVLQYSTYLGGRGNDEGNAITVDSAGNAYIIGFTDSIDFPTANAAQPAIGGGLQDVFVSKLDPSGSQLLYSTYIGGNGQDNGSAIVVDAFGNAYITGFTGSTNFPAMNAMQPANSGRFNAFVAKLSPTGSLLYSTHLGGSVGDYGSSIALDPSGNVYVAGVATSPNFPLVNAVQPVFAGAADVYVAKLNPAGNQLVYSSYLGGAGNDGATSLAADSAGNVYVTGVTTSPNFRTASPLQTAHGGGLFDAFVAKLNLTGTQLVYSTYLGGTGEDRSFRIAVDAAGNAYVTGDTDSVNFPTANALQRNKFGGVDAFVVKLNPSGTSLTYSTYLGGSSIEGGTGIAVDSVGRAYVTGFTGSPNFPAVAAVQQALGGGSFDGFVAKLNPAGSALDYSTFLGGSGIDSGFGIAVDSSGNAYVMGVTNSVDFPTVAPIQAATSGGTSDLFVARIASSGLSITRAEIQGKHLFVFGSGFDSGAKILIDGEVHQKTRNDEADPAGVLFGKKAGKKIAPGQTAALQVRNPDGAMSNPFQFSRP